MGLKSNLTEHEKWKIAEKKKKAKKKRELRIRVDKLERIAGQVR